MQRKTMLERLTFQNIVQVGIYLVSLGILVGVNRANTSASNDQIAQNKSDIVDMKRERDEDRKAYAAMASDIKLILYRLDEQDKRATKQ